MLATLPILLVYFFAVQFLNKGIDSWFNVEIRQQPRRRAGAVAFGARGAHARAPRGHASASPTNIIANGGPTPGAARIAAPAGRRARARRWRRERGSVIAVEQGPVVGRRARGSARRSAAAGAAGPAVRQPRAAAGRRLPVRTAVSLGHAMPGRGRGMVLQAVYPVAERLGALADTVQAAYQQFGEKDYLRKPLKASFILTLTVVLLLSLLAALYGAIFTAQRLVQPIQDLVQGHARGRAGRPRHAAAAHVARRDGIPGALVQRHDQAPARAREETSTRRSRRRRTSAPTSRSSSRACRPASISLEPDLRVRTANQAASMILGEDLESRVGAGLAELGADADGLRAAVRRVPAARASTPARPSGASRSRCRAGAGPPRADVRLHAAARAKATRRAATCSCSTTSPRCCRRSARRPGAKWRAASRTRSRTR